MRIYHGSQAVAQDAYEALINSLNKLTMPSIINVHLSDDASSAMKRFAEHLTHLRRFFAKSRRFSPSWLLKTDKTLLNQRLYFKRPFVVPSILDEICLSLEFRIG